MAISRKPLPFDQVQVENLIRSRLKSCVPPSLWAFYIENKLITKPQGNQAANNIGLIEIPFFSGRIHDNDTEKNLTIYDFFISYNDRYRGWNYSITYFNRVIAKRNPSNSIKNLDKILNEFESGMNELKNIIRMTDILKL